MVNKFLKSRRALQGLNQTQMASNLKISVGSYCQKENGNTKFTADEYMIMANMFNVTMKKLLMGGQ